MSRAIGLFAVVVLLALWSRSGQTSAAVQAPVRVQVTAVNCSQDSVTITISPWVARVRAGDNLAWIHTGPDSISIRPLTPGNWPFPASNPRAARGAQASAGVLPPVPPGLARRHQYEIRMFCGSRVIVIDPDVEIGE